jgi:hypothetical protein
LRPQLKRDPLDGSMSPETSRHDVLAFFESYARAFERCDAAAIAGHCAFPLQIVDDGEGTEPMSVLDRPSWIAVLNRLIELYRRIELGSARFVASTVAEIAPGLLHVLVNWQLENRAGQGLYKFTAVYTVKRLAQGLRITAITHNELSQSRAFLESRREGRSEREAAV